MKSFKYNIKTLFLVLISLISLIWFAFILRSFHFTDAYDWDKCFAYHEFQRMALVIYHQIPLWNPYICGGEPWIGHPNSDFFSPFLIFSIILGTVKGTLFTHFLLTCLGLAGMFFLSRYYRLSYLLSFLNALFFLNTYNLLMRLEPLMVLGISLLPWVYLCFNKSKDQDRYVLFVALLIMMIIFGGDNLWVLLMSFMIIAIDICYYTFVKKTSFFFMLALKAFVFVFFLSALKLFPMVEAFIQIPRPAPLTFFPGIGNLKYIWTGLLELKHFFFAKNNLYTVLPFGQYGLLGYCLPITVILLFLLSFFMLWKKHRQLVFMNIFFLLLALGDNSPINLWRMLHYVFPMLKVPYKFFLVLFLPLSLSLGLTVMEIQERFTKLKKWNILIGLLLIAIVGFGVFSAASGVFKDQPIISYDLKDGKESFIQATGNPRRMFESIYNNKGVLNGYDNVGNFITSSVVSSEDPLYRGEFFLLNSHGNAEQIFFSPNKLSFKFNLDADDLLVINQNYFPGWRSSVGKVINHKGLIGIFVNKEQKQVSLQYLPVSFLAGMSVSVMFIFFIIIRKGKLA